MDDPKFIYVNYIASTPEKVWEALTTPEFTRKFWGGRSVESEWTVGARVQSIRPDGGVEWDGEILKADRPKVLSYTFCSYNEGSAGWPTRVTFTIEPYGSLVRLTTTHENFEPGGNQFERVGFGWPAILSNFKTLLETGEPLVFDAWKG